MKSLNMILMTLMVMALTACGSGGGGGDGGGGGGGGGGTGGSATFSSITYNSSGGTQCVKSGSKVSSYADNYNTQTSCQNAGGTWHSNVNSYPAAGDVCRVGSRDYKLRANGSANGAETTACVDAGGSVIAQNSETLNYCDISSISPAITCSDIGGTEYSTEVLTGSFSSASIAAGTNTITADPTEVLNAIEAVNGTLFNGLDNLTVTPAVITADVTISNYWDYTVSMSYSVTSFQSAVSPAVKFSATAPFAVSGNFSFRSNSVKIYYRPF